jgi:hypothetical protein
MKTIVLYNWILEYPQNFADIWPKFVYRLNTSEHLAHHLTKLMPENYAKLTCLIECPEGNPHSYQFAMPTLIKGGL